MLKQSLKKNRSDPPCGLILEQDEFLEQLARYPLSHTLSEEPLPSLLPPNSLKRITLRNLRWDVADVTSMEVSRSVRCTCSVHVVYSMEVSKLSYWPLCTCSVHVVYMQCTCSVQYGGKLSHRPHLLQNGNRSQLTWTTTTTLTSRTTPELD